MWRRDLDGGIEASTSGVGGATEWCSGNSAGGRWSENMAVPAAKK